jgi:DNA-binding NtrC family response regulator
VNGQKRVLVVDDDRDMVQTLCDILELHGWETLRGYDGESAVSISASTGVNVVLMDVRMPQMSGVEAWQQIHARDPKARSVLMTAYAPPEALALTTGQGVVTILRKPLTVPELISALESARGQAS